MIYMSWFALTRLKHQCSQDTNLGSKIGLEGYFCHVASGMYSLAWFILGICGGCIYYNVSMFTILLLLEEFT